jgi:hypothetical protein
MQVLADAESRVVWVSRRFEEQECVLAFCFSDETVQVHFPFEGGLFRKCFDSSSSQTDVLPEDGVEHAFHRGESVRLEPFTAVLYERGARTTATEVHG